jgi:hypothetical protein
VEQGNCTRKRGTFVNGTLEAGSLTYDSWKRTLGYSYTGSEGTIGTGVIGLSSPRTDELDAKGLAFVTGMAARVDASNEMLIAFPAASVAGTVVLAGVPYGAATTLGWGYGWTGGTGVVLGPLADKPNYAAFAQSIGANAFKVSDRVWNGLGSIGQTWTANEAFLQMSIWRSQQFFLSGGSATARGTFARELQYLTSKGIGPAQWITIKRP